MERFEDLMGITHDTGDAFLDKKLNQNTAYILGKIAAGVIGAGILGKKSKVKEYGGDFAKGIRPYATKGLKDLEKWSTNPNAENWIETFRTPSAKGQTDQSDFSLNLRNYIQGKPVKARAKELFDSVNIKNLLGDTVKDIQTYTPQELFGQQTTLQ